MYQSYEVYRLYGSKSNRDKDAAELKAKGYTVKKSSSRYSVIDLHYLHDSNEPDRGLANRQYAGPLYRLEATRH